MYFQPLQTQQVDQPGHALHPPLPGRDDISIRRLAFAPAHGITRFEIKTIDKARAVSGNVIQRHQHTALHVVGVVAQRPLCFFQRGIGAVPLHRGHPLRNGALEGFGDMVAECFVESSGGIAQVGHPDEIIAGPAVVKAMRPYTGHAGTGELGHFLVRQIVPFVDGEGIEMLVVRPESGGDIEKRHGFVQVVHDRGFPVHEALQDIARQRKAEAVAVAVVVMCDILAPEGEIRSDTAIAGAVTKNIDDAIAAVRFGDRAKDENHIPADHLHEGSLFDGKAIGQLHHHLGRAGLGRMQPGGDIIDRAGCADEVLRAVRAESPRISQTVERTADDFQRIQPGLVRNDHLDHLAVFLGSADGTHHHPGRGFGQSAQVGVNFIDIVQPARCTDDGSEKIQRRGHGVGLWQMIYQGIEKMPGCCVLTDFRAVQRVVLPGYCPAREQGKHEAGEEKCVFLHGLIHFIFWRDRLIFGSFLNRHPSRHTAPAV